MKLVVILVALVALLVACAAPYGDKKSDRPFAPPSSCGRTFVVSPAFTGEEQKRLTSAIGRWNEIAIEQFCLRPAEEDERAEDTENGIFRIPYKGELWKSLSESAGGADILGVYRAKGQIGIVDVLSPDLFEAVALHELGHAHGLEHTAAPAIMHFAAGTAYDFTPIDLAECQRVGACQKEDEDG